MTNAVFHSEGWPTLMTSEMAARYLLIGTEVLIQLSVRYSVHAVEFEDTELRWRKQDLDRLVKKLPLVTDLPTIVRPARLI